MWFSEDLIKSTRLSKIQSEIVMKFAIDCARSTGVSSQLPFYQRITVMKLSDAVLEEVGSVVEN
jgi:hypothetical protein